MCSYLYCMCVFIYTVCVCIFLMCLGECVLSWADVQVGSSWEKLTLYQQIILCLTITTTKKHAEMGILNMSLKPLIHRQQKLTLRLCMDTGHLPLVLFLPFGKKGMMFDRRICNMRATWLCLSTCQHYSNKRKSPVSIFELNHSVCPTSSFVLFPWQHKSSNESTKRPAIDEIN